MDIYKEFKHISDFELLRRQANYISNNVERKDSLFSQLARLYSLHPKKFKKLKKKIKTWLKKEKSETIFSLSGYIHYIAEDFPRAKKYFLKSISYNPDNLDNWVDLAFALRHLGEYKVSETILFNYDYVIYYYKYLKLNSNDFSKLRSLVLEISKRTSADNV